MLTDKALVRAWKLAIEDHTDAVEAEVERLLPPLIEAGYVEADECTWSFTPEGVERAEALTGE